MTLKKFNIKYLYYAYYVVCIIVLLNLITNTFPLVDGLFDQIRHYLPLLGILLIFTKQNLKFSPLLIVLVPLQLLAQSQRIPYDNFIYLIIFYLLFNDENADNFIKLHFYCLGIYTVLLSVSVFLGIIDPVEYYLGSRYRRSLSFGHPNMLAMVLLSIHACWFYLIERKHFKKKLPIIISLIVNILLCLFYYDTRTGALSLIFILFMVLSFDYLKRFFIENINLFSIFRLSWILPILCLFISLFLTVKFDININLFDRLNGLISGRLYLQQGAFFKYGFPLFGEGLAFSAGGEITYDYVDAFYNAKIYEYGLLALCCFLLIISFKLRAFLKNQSPTLALLLISIMLIYCLEAFLEKETFSFMICPFLVYLFISTNVKQGDSHE